MVAAHQQLPVSGQATQERGDAARNRDGSASGPLVLALDLLVTE